MNKLINHSFPSLLILLLFFLIGGIYLFADSMELYPSFVHAWTQSDRIALAQNFQQNGFDFFHPATYNLLTKEGVTQVDFPVHDYLIALLSSVFKVDVVSTFRYYNVVYSMVGLYFFYLSLLLLSGSGKRAVFGTLFLLTLPFFVFYQNGFLPSVPSFANFLIGLYFFLKFHKTKQLKNYNYAIAWLTLAALSRSPFVVFLIAMLIERIWNAESKKNFIGQAMLGIGIFIAYFIYNSYLGRTYGSMFLGELLYFDSLESFIEITSVAWDRWADQLLSPFHFVVFSVLIFFYFKQRRIKQLGNAAQSTKAWLLISFIGVLLFFLAMGKQFADHDYYYIDTFLPLFTLLLLLLLSQVQIPKQYYTPFALLCLIFIPYFFSYAHNIQAERYTPKWDDRIHYAYKSYKKTSLQLKQLGIEPTDTLLELDAVSTNMPYTLWGNKGYTLLNSGEDTVRSGLQKNFDFAFMVDSSFRLDSWQDFPEIVYHLDYYSGNEEISFYTKSKDTSGISFFDNLIYHGTADFDAKLALDSASLSWMKTEQVDDKHGQSYYAPKNYEYFLSTKIKAEAILQNKPVYVLIEADYYLPEDTTKMQLIVSHGDYYAAHYLESQINQVGKWQSYLYRNKISPEKLNQNEEFSLYFWNPKQDEIYLDNLNIIVYQ